MSFISFIPTASNFAQLYNGLKKAQQTYESEIENPAGYIIIMKKK